MNNILAIECATDICTVALSTNGTIHQRKSHESRSNAKLILPMVHDLLASSSIDFGKLSALCVTIGPGSFTGIRIGLSLVQGLSYGSQLPVYTWSTLEVMAAAKLLSNKQPGKELVVALDARMGEIYWASYCLDASQQVDSKQAILERDPPGLTSLENFKQIMLEKRQAASVIGLGSGFTELIGEFGESDALIDTEAKPEARTMVDLLMRYPDLKTPVRNPSLLEPLYLRNEITWKKRVWKK